MDNYIGEIRVFAGNFAPVGWALCDGSLLAISDNDVLYSLIGTTYGGDGQQTFAVPSLQGRVVVGQGVSGQGTDYPVGMAGGKETVTLTTLQMPVHEHPIFNINVNAVTGGAAQTSPVGAYFGDQGASAYATSSSGQTLNAGTVTGQSTPSGTGQPHSNIQPVLALNYIIALQGIYPSFD